MNRPHKNSACDVSPIRKRRRFGASPVELSSLSFGTAHLAPPFFDARSAADLLVHAIGLGISTFHVSLDYKSFPTVCKAFELVRQALPNTTTEILLKVVTFEEPGDRVASQIAIQVRKAATALGVTCIDIGQWVCRGPRADPGKVPQYAFGELAECQSVWKQLKDEGVVRAVAVFGANAALATSEASWVDGLFGFLDPSRLEVIPHLANLRPSQGFVALQPFVGGNIFTDAQVWRSLGTNPEERLGLCLDFPLLYPATSSVVAGFSSFDHLEQSAAALTVGQPSQQHFHELVEQLTAHPRQ